MSYRIDPPSEGEEHASMVEKLLERKKMKRKEGGNMTQCTPDGGEE